MPENVPTEVDWDDLLKEIEDKCGIEIANAIRHRIAVLDRRVKNLEIGEDEETWQWWS